MAEPATAGRVTVDQATADVIVVGAGPAGIAAACVAAVSGARVTVLDMAPHPGGQIWRHTRADTLPRRARDWLDRLDASGARFVPRATVIDAIRDLETVDPDRATTTLVVDVAGEPRLMMARRIVIATGARELFLPFPGWTLPNVIGLGGAQALLKAGASFTGKRVVVAGSGPLVLPVAALMTQSGARLEAVAEQAPGAAVWSFATSLWRTPAKLTEAARYRAAFARTRYRTGTWVTAAHGDSQVRRVTLTDGRATWTVACDVLCAAYGLVPNIELARLLDCDVADGAVVVDRWQRTSVGGGHSAAVLCAGEPTGIAGVDAAVAQGEVAGTMATGRTSAPVSRSSSRSRHFAARLAATFAPRPELFQRITDDTIVCRCEDVPAGRVRSCTSSREAKLLTRAGMGPCQERICGPMLRAMYGWIPGSVRPPLFPALVGTLAGAEW